MSQTSLPSFIYSSLSLNNIGNRAVAGATALNNWCAVAGRKFENFSQPSASARSFAECRTISRGFASVSLILCCKTCAVHTPRCCIDVAMKSGPRNNVLCFQRRRWNGRRGGKGAKAAVEGKIFSPFQPLPVRARWMRSITHHQVKSSRPYDVYLLRR